MRQPNQEQAGFTAVELLITLFVAALFLFAGYQLFNIVLASGAASRSQAAASTTANMYLQQYTDSIGATCAASTPLNNSAITVTGLSNAKVTVAITCPVASAPKLSQLNVTVSYGTGTDANSVSRSAYRSAP